MVHLIENFFGCYLLYCINPKYKGRTYIGYTVNPERRISQHNAGKHKGGAWRTSGRGPWHMVLIVHGFPSDISALRFEWAWQHPDRSRRLKNVPKKNRKETAFQYRVRVLSNILCEPPWSILPLTIRWIRQEYCTELSPSPASHIPLAYGPVAVKPSKKSSSKQMIGEIQDPKSHDGESIPQHNTEADSTHTNCGICLQSLMTKTPLQCLGNCQTSFHIKCLAQYFLKDNKMVQIIPVDGNCPNCQQYLLWGDMIRSSNGFHQYLETGETF